MPISQAERQRILAWVERQTATLDRANFELAHADLVVKVEATHRACRAALSALASRDDREAVLTYREPLPESTVRALARLRRRSP